MQHSASAISPAEVARQLDQTRRSHTLSHTLLQCWDTCRELEALGWYRVRGSGTCPRRVFEQRMRKGEHLVTIITALYGGKFVHYNMQPVPLRTEA